MRNLQNNKWIIIVQWVVLAIVCFGVAFGIEKYVLNRTELSSHGLNQDINLAELSTDNFNYEDGQLVSTDTNCKIILPARGFVDSVEVTYTLGSQYAAMVYSAEDYPGYVFNSDNKQVWMLDARAKTTCRKVTMNTDNLYLFFVDINKPLYIEAIKYSCEYVFHWQRFFVIAMCLLAFCVIIFGRKQTEKHPERIAIVVAALMGIGMLVSVPYEKNSWDDETHFANAYCMAETITGDKVQWSQATDSFINIRYPQVFSYQDRLDVERRMNADAQIDTETEATKNIGFFIKNLDAFPTAIGIVIAQAIFHNFVDWFVLARVLNLVFYCVVIYFAIKIMPIGKSLLAFLALLPTPIFLTVTYNTDYFMNSLMFLATAAFFHEFYSNERRVSKKHFITFIVAMMVACSRKMIYVPLILIGLFIPKEKFESKKQRWIYRIVPIICTVAEMAIVMFSASGLSDERVSDTSVAGQMQYIIHNPIRFAIFFIKGIVKNSFTFVFGADAKLNFNVSGMRGGGVQIVMIIFMVYLILHAKGMDKDKRMTPKHSIVGLGLIALVICFIWGSMYLAYTPVGSGAISGVQARYYTPFLLLLFMFLPIQKIQVQISEEKMMNITLMMIILLHLATIWGILIHG